MSKTCSQSECGRSDLYGRGLCGKHYQFYRYHGRLDEVAPRPKGRRCSSCGGPIEASLRQWAAQFCSSRCAHQSRYQAQKPDRQHEACQQCGIPLDNRPQARFCSDRCSADHRNAATKARLRANRKPCAHCGVPIPLQRSRFCSNACRRAHRRADAYNLTTEEMAALLAQHSLCAVCGDDNWGRKGPQIDHDHATGAIRGVLCSTWNLILGLADDNPDRLRAAADYLSR